MLVLPLLFAMLLPVADAKPLDGYSQACAVTASTHRPVTLHVGFDAPNGYRIEPVGPFRSGQTWQAWYNATGKLVGRDVTPAKAAPNAALASLNQQRAQRGLRSYIEDPLLTIAARRAAEFRAAR